jgi:hypothetical protein
MMTKLDKTHYAKMIRLLPDEVKYMVKIHSLTVHNVECHLVNNWENKMCFAWKSPDVKYECYMTDPVVSIEKIENGCRIVTYCGMIYKLEEK